MTTTIENPEFSKSFEYYKENCENFKATKFSKSIVTPWMYRCYNFEKKINPNNIYLSNTCHNCKYLDLKKKD